MVDADLAVERLEHRNRDGACIDRCLQRFDLRAVAPVQHGKTLLRASEFGQHLVNMRRAVLGIVDGDGGGDLRQFFNGGGAIGFGQYEIGLEGDNRLQIGIDGADIGDVAIVEINTGQNGAGAQIGFAVRSHAAVAAHRRHA